MNINGEINTFWWDLIKATEHSTIITSPRNSARVIDTVVTDCVAPIKVALKELLETKIQ